MEQVAYTENDIVPRGKEIYEQTLKAKLEPEHIGEFLVIDIETGEYEIDSDSTAASLRAYEKKPDGLRFGMRIGYRSSGTLGGKRPKRAV